MTNKMEQTGKIDFEVTNKETQNIQKKNAHSPYDDTVRKRRTRILKFLLHKSELHFFVYLKSFDVLCSICVVLLFDRS